jgi:predicted outer membrane repeat protein
VHGGILRLTSCTIEVSSPPTSTEAGRALTLSGGHTMLSQTVLSAHSAGAIHVLHSASLTLIECTVEDCRAQTGGAVLVDGPRSKVVIANSSLINNSATVSGGAIQVNAGSVHLLNETMLTKNSAPSGSSTMIVDGSVAYALPAPPGRWVLAPDGLTSLLQRGSIDTDFPFVCSAGLVSGSSAVEQSTPGCGGAW